MLSFSDVLSSGFLPHSSTDHAISLSMIACGFLNSVLLFIWTLRFSGWKHLGVLSRPSNLHHFSRNFSRLGLNTDTALDFFNVRTSHDLPDHRLNKYIKKRNCWLARDTLFCQSCALLCILWRWFSTVGQTPIKSCSHVCFPPQGSCRGQDWVEAFQCNAP